MLAQIESWNIAKDLIEARLRLTITASLTGLTIAPLRKLWWEVNKTMPPKGKLPESSLSFIANRTEAAALAAFVGIHLKMHGGPDPSPVKLLASWRTYQKFMGELDINAAYFALRDVRSQLVNFVVCSGCRGQFIHDVGSHLTSCCPHCLQSPTS